MGGFSGSNPLVKVGAAAIDAYTGVPVASTLAMAGAARQQQAQQAAAVQQTYDMQAQALQRQQQQQVRDQQDLLKRTLASQRARLGALGIGGTGGSADALAEGLIQQGATKVADIQGAYGDQLAGLDWKYRQQMDQLDEANNNFWGSQLLSVVQPMLPGKGRKGTQAGDLWPEDAPMESLSLL
ncbi:MAG TPA: hypothetical protein VL974_10780 [Magnetospirillum sp.]|jgi:hypothetical protein|nr:hypothetical protein [Magnetospirillum sp.]